MGGYKKYNPEGGFSEYLLRQVGDPITVDGLTVKVVTGIDDKTFHSELPSFSNTSSAYAKKSDEYPHDIEQLRIYVDREACIDFDWNHEHQGLKRGVVHIHYLSKDGHFHSDKKNVRYMNEDEIVKYGKLILAPNPKVKFRP